MSAYTADEPITVEWGKQQIEVSTVDQVPDASDVDERNKLVKAGMRSPLVALPEDAWHAVARAAVTPETVALQLRESKDARASLLLEEHVDGATLRSVHSRVWLSELFPAIQPRTGQEILAVDDPQVTGMAENGKPQAILRYRYESLQHLKRHVQQTISTTLYRNSYAESILARRVTRALIVHPVIYEFDDGGEPVCALVARDGITRLASAWKVLAGPDSDPEQVAALAVEALLAQYQQSANEPPKPLTQRMALGRQARRKALRDEFAREMAKAGADKQPSLRAIQIAQSHVVPAHITVGAQVHERTALNAEDLFDDALRSILASVHVEFKPWDTAAQNVEVAGRALKRVLHGGTGSGAGKDGLHAVYELAVGLRAASDTPHVYGDQSIPGTGLWRAVQLLHTLTRPNIFEELRTRAKEIKGDRRMTDKGYAGLLGPIVDHPWRSTKKAAAQQARNAWSNGGVLFKEVLEDGWAPTVTEDFRTLVEPALKGNRDARLTLALAGGTALIADKLLTRNVGSSVGMTRAPGKVPFRSDVHKIVEGLAREGNEIGLRTLAWAAQRFEDDRLPRNSGTRQQLGLPYDQDTEKQGDYQHSVVDLQASDHILVAEGEPVMLLEWDVVVASDPARARQTLGPAQDAEQDDETAEPDGTAVAPSPWPEGTENVEDSSQTASDVEVPVEQQIRDRRRTLNNCLADARAHVDALAELGQTVTFPPLLGPAEDWKTLRDIALHVLNTIQNHKADYADEEQIEE
ncbi:hypothetical protein [Streptomyces sp. ITFR-16]|uniref:hypothetical protein n=1 Tax=Streptomyces sp. ITFR-16 TaxID=3075198 RepID=UPI00288AE44A|nr:hypothetical protein [Streptomyces sp. ITFR-16]WNI24266.1 hypothetical protein RLT58_21185 [Streptomyces sp. ITFR-16]